MAEENQSQAPAGAQSEPAAHESSERDEVAAKDAEELANLKAIRDSAPEPEHLADGEPNRNFIAYRDCDRILARGTVVEVGGVKCRLLVDAPVMAPEFREEAVFAESLAQTGAGLVANASGLRKRYSANGSPVGVNEENGHNRLDARIAELEAALAPKEEKAE